MNKEKITNFKDLNSWKSAHQLVLLVYKITKNFPKEEMFGISGQMRRAAVSITSNIAEGFSRASYKDKTSFYIISLGSLTELQSQAEVAYDLGYFRDAGYKEFLELALEVHKLLNGLINKSREIHASNHNSSFIIHNSGNGGYVALTSVLIVGFIASVIMVSLITLGLGYSRSGASAAYGVAARAAADACTEEALRQIRANVNFTGTNIAVTLPGASCTYTVVNTGGTTRQIDAVSTATGSTRKTRVNISALNPKINISSWQEIQ